MKDARRRLNKEIVLPTTDIQLVQGGSVVDRAATDPIDSHPGAIFHRRLEHLPTLLSGVEWDGDQVVGFGD